MAAPVARWDAHCGLESCAYLDDGAQAVAHDTGDVEVVVAVGIHLETRCLALARRGIRCSWHLFSGRVASGHGTALISGPAAASLAHIPYTCRSDGTVPEN